MLLMTIIVAGIIVVISLGIAGFTMLTYRRLIRNLEETRKWLQEVAKETRADE